MYRELALHVARVLYLSRLEQHHFNLVLSNRPVLDSARYDDKFSLLHFHAPVPEIHTELAAHNQKEFIIWGRKDL